MGESGRRRRWSSASARGFFFRKELMRRWTTLAILMSAALAGTAVAQVPTSSQQIPPAVVAQQPSAIASDAPIGPRDVVEIRVFQDPSLTTRRTVGDDGNITMPPLGKVPVAGLTTSQVEQRIKGMLESRFFNKADVTVELLEAGSKPISVVGAVMRPG